MVLYRKQSYSCCQLIAAINARIFLGGDDVDEEKYEKLVSLAKCRHGAALNMKEVWPLLGLEVVNGPVDTLDLDWVRNNLPVEIGYHDPEKGFHSALVIEVKGHDVLLVNASWPQKAWREIYFFPHLYNRTLRSFRLTNQKVTNV